MTYNKNIIITESEKNRILNLYGRPQIKESIVIAEWLSPDEKYCIFLDDLIDIKNKTKIGNIWENFDNFKFFLKHSFEVAKDIPETIKESVLSSINGLILTESNQDIRHLKPIIKEMLFNEQENDLFNKIKKGTSQWAKDTITSTGDFIKTSFSGVQKLVGNISAGQWNEVVKLISNGALYVARKIRSALHNPGGIILDAILIATGVGVGVLFVNWGIVVALDVYELMTGNFENKDSSLLERLFLMGIDIMGLVTAGIAAKATKSLISSIFKNYGTSTEGLIKASKANPKFKALLESMMSLSKSAGSSMGKVASFLKTKSPMLYKFVSSILNALGSFVAKLTSIIGTILRGTGKILKAPGNLLKKGLGGGRLGKGAKAGFETTALVGGLGAYQQMNNTNGEDEFIKTLTNANVSFDGA